MIKIVNASAAAILAVALAGCSFLTHRKTTTESAGAISSAGSGARTSASSVGELGSRYGCTAAQVEDNWRRYPFSIARSGTPICNVLGRYGEPISVTVSNVANMQLVSMLHRQPSGRYYNATFVFYADTKVNRQLKRPVGKWLVERVTATR